MSQSIRRSQYITIYGPGAILETANGPRVVASLAESGLFNNRQRATDFEITYQDLSRAVLQNAGILRLPSNAELGKSDIDAVYSTYPFPSWALCTQHKRLYQKTQPDRQTCPNCRSEQTPEAAWSKVRREAIRFVRACEDGHLDDVDWKNLVQHRQDGCNPSYLVWGGTGGALRNIVIRCPDCQGTMDLGTAYGRTFNCSARRPEEGSNRTYQCTKPARIIQRGAANLHLAEIETALTIPPRSTNLHRLLEMERVRIVLLTSKPVGKQALLDELNKLVTGNLLKPNVVTQLDQYPEGEIRQAINDVLADDLPTTPEELRLREFEALYYAATNGAPPTSSPTPRTPPQFEVIASQVRTVVSSGGQRLRVTPINRLRVVMVQKGYRRLDPLNPLVDCAYDDGQRLWYPGAELFGEGIFLDLQPGAGQKVASSHFPMQGDAYQKWLSSWFRFSDDDIAKTNFERRNYLHPVFVWWHTLAHRLINALSVDSGYSSASVRERVYIKADEKTGNACGGILFYTVQPGGDGTLGGLVALVPQFERVLRSALRNLDACSNDPLCGEETYNGSRYNGAACYVCALISETSCEHRNMRLDRNLLRQNMP
jgi:hypothetical protein